VEITRDFTATTFVVWQGKVLLHKHKKLAMWLPCGGHIEENELPDDAAVREVLEESGVEVVLVGEKALELNEPRQLIRPRGIQLETIEPGHEHIDLIYFGEPVAGYEGTLLENDPSLGWYSPAELRTMDLSEEIRAWVNAVLSAYPF